MKHTMQDAQLEQLLIEYSESRVFPDQDQILIGLKAHIAPQKQTRSFGKAAALLLAALAILTTTAFAKDIAQAIKQIAMPNIIATQQEELISDFDGEEITSNIEWIGSSQNLQEIGDFSKAEWVTVTTLEEAQAALDFEIRQPKYLPDDYVFHHASLLRYETGKYDQTEVTLNYQKPIYGHMFPVIIDQYHVGPDGGMDVKTVENVSQVKVGDLDALVLSSEHGGSELFFVKQGIAFRVCANDLETEIKIAESIG